MTRPIVALLTDYGVGTQHVGALHAVLARHCPEADRIDLAHDIPPGDVRWGALLLERLAAELPGAVFLAVVDPGVGTDRRAVALALDDGGRVVGPDNGLLGPLATRGERAVRIDPAAARSATFHGRDLFAPAAARLARGAPLIDLGSPMPISAVRQPVIPAATVGSRRIETVVLGRDRFGNLALAGGRDDLEAAGLAAGDAVSINAEAARVGRVFADVAVSALLLYVDSNSMLSVAVRDGDAAAALGIAAGDGVVIEAR